MPFDSRRLPQLYEPGRPVFVTWRLEDSLPAHRHFDLGAMTTIESFQALDSLLDETHTGARHLAVPAIAEAVSESIRHCAAVMNQYKLHSFAVMPNHVHLLITPNNSLAQILDSLKGFTARRASALLPQPGQSFWLAESFARMVRDRWALETVRRYIEENPVRAMLVKRAEDYAWSSANGRWAVTQSHAKMT